MSWNVSHSLFPVRAKYTIIKSKCSFPNQYTEWMNKLWAKLFLWGTFSLLWAVSVQEALGRQESRIAWEGSRGLWSEFCQIAVSVKSVNTHPFSQPELLNRTQVLKKACGAACPNTETASEVTGFRTSKALSLGTVVIYA